MHSKLCTFQRPSTLTLTLALTHREYGNTKMTFTDEEFKKLPSVLFAFKDINGKMREIEMAPSSYMEKNGHQYVPRIYVTEGSGAVLGANFMQVSGVSKIHH